MPSRLPSIVLVLSLLTVLTACVQTSPSPLPTPAPTIDLPETLVSSRWTLLEFKIAGHPIDVERLRPVYLSFQERAVSPNSLYMMLETKCYVDENEPLKPVRYEMQIVSPGTYHLVMWEEEANPCDPQIDPPRIRLVESIFSTHGYAIEDEILVLRGTDDSSGEDILIRWER